ncbi:hypothetical protein WICPIJ_008125 [Wickerhamomyces pijperi]|uniref:Uncharacterized protein n=1 Tax=Wickerhamomyces pijperi TaxID=599730 RepID=A0A9P8PYD0_WICPI|nr:hypothetical protein WICPIJ_008125 [Wickerhamomyces pijperi]
MVVSIVDNGFTKPSDTNQEPGFKDIKGDGAPEIDCIGLPNTRRYLTSVTNNSQTRLKSIDQHRSKFTVPRSLVNGN